MLRTLTLRPDTHLHASQYPNVGIFGKSTLLDWLNRYTFPLEASLKDIHKARKVYSRVIRKTLSHGTTCAAYYATIDVPSTNLLADLCAEAGQRALVGRVCMDQLAPDWYRDESWERSLADTKESIAHIKRIDPEMSVVRPVITPRFAPSCSGKLLKGLGDLARETGLPVQTHISENKGEIELVKEMFPKEETGAGGDSYTAVYDVYGLLTDTTILAHGIHLSEEEVALIKQRGSKVSHCPCSNSSITSGEARVRWLLDKGVGVGLGTDMSGGYSPSVLEAARAAALVSRHVAMKGDDSAKLSVEEVLYLATRGGAEVVGLDGRVGGFEVGMEWDAQLIGLAEVDDQGGVEGEEEDGNVDVFGWESWEEKVAKWLFNGDDRNTKKVWIKGRLVHARK
jgi:guanine deaminase